MLLKPIYLLADSGLFFWRAPENLLLDGLKHSLESVPAKAAYLGASNGDESQFYSIFTAAMDGIEVNNCRMIRSSFSTEDAAFLNEADIILLAGGEVERGWDIFVKNGLQEVLVRRYHEGAILIGVSAGAVQLGLFGWRGEELSSENLIRTLGLVPFVIGVHEEKEGWERLRQALRFAAPKTHGIGISAGAGMIFHADRSVEPIRYPLYEFASSEEEIVSNLLLPVAARETIEAEQCIRTELVH
jgi:peptidase E